MVACVVVVVVVVVVADVVVVVADVVVVVSAADELSALLLSLVELSPQAVRKEQVSVRDNNNDSIFFFIGFTPLVFIV